LPKILKKYFPSMPKNLKEASQSTLASLFSIMPKCKNIINFLAESKWQKNIIIKHLAAKPTQVLH